MNNKFRTLIALFLITLLCSACQEHTEEPLQCTTTADCYNGELCRQARCVLVSQDITASEQPTTMDVHYDGSQTLPPGPVDAPRQEHASAADMNEAWEEMRAEMTPSMPRDWVDQSPNYGIGSPEHDMDSPHITPELPCEGVAPMVGELVINELLMNVPSGEEGDANADGTRDAYDDEFIELVNISSLTLSLKDVELMVNDNVRHAFTPRCLEPGQAIVIFSGPRDRVPTWREDVLFMAPDSKLGLSNSAGKVELWDEFDRVLFSFSYEGAQKTAYVLWPELVGDTFVPHNEVSSTLFSPGRCANGQALATRCGEQVVEMDGQ